MVLRLLTFPLTSHLSPTVIPTEQARRFFFPPRSCEAVGLRREESLFVCAFAFFTSMSATLRERESNIMKKKN